MKKIKIRSSNFFINLAFIIVASIILIRPYLERLLSGSMLVSMLLIICIIFLIISILCSQRILNNNRTFCICCLLYLTPYFINNAYIKDGFYSYAIFYIGTILFTIVLSFIKIKKENILFLLRIFFVFSILTSIVTWISIYYPYLYDNVFISLLPNSDKLIVKTDFWNQGMRMGLTNHYSRNAFYIILGILSSIVFYRKSNKRIYIMIAIGFLGTLFVIGKRGHLIFLIISLFLSYSIYTKMSIKKFFKIILYIIIFLLCSILIIQIIPEGNNIIERLFNSSSGDISTGRFELYERIWKLFKENNYRALGWGEFSRFTNYFFAGAHNDYIQLFCETGWIGFLIIIWCNFYFFFRSLKKIKKANKKEIFFIILTYNIFFLLYSLTGLPHYDLEVYLTYFILNCFLWNYKAEVEGEK